MIRRLAMLILLAAMGVAAPAADQTRLTLPEAIVVAARQPADLHLQLAPFNAVQLWTTLSLPSV